MAQLNTTYLRSVNIDLISSDANTSLSDTHKTFYLDQEIQVPRNTHALIALTSFNMIYSFYQFRENVNDRFTLTIDGVSNVVVIDEGNYSITELITYLNTTLAGIRLSYGLNSIYMQGNYKTNKMYLKVNPFAEVEFSDILAFKELGFASKETTTFSRAGTFNFPYQFNLAGDPSIYIRLQNQQVVNLNSKHIDGVIANIPVQCLFGEYIFYSPAEPQYFRCSSNLHKLEISILDQDMKDIASLNSSSPWRMTFTVHFSYNKDVILHPSDNLIKFSNLFNADNIEEKKNE